MTTLRLGTRRSALATTQSTWVADRLRALGHDVELVEVTTEGDRDRSTPLARLGGTGVFVSALRTALAEGRVDLAVHSLKDLPTTPDEATTVAAVPTREDPRDALVARDGQGGSYARALSELFDLDPRDVSLVSAPPKIPEDEA